MRVPADVEPDEFRAGISVFIAWRGGRRGTASLQAGGEVFQPLQFVWRESLGFGRIVLAIGVERAADLCGGGGGVARFLQRGGVVQSALDVVRIEADGGVVI